MIRRRPTLFLALLLLTAAIPASATIVRALSIEQLTATADVIVEGRVTAQSSSWNDEKTRIYTVTTLAVSTAHKGPVKPGETLQIRQIGGTVDGLTQSIVGNAKLSVGEEMLVFLSRDEARGLHYVVGMAQGKFTIDRATPTPRIDRALQDLSTLDAKGSPVPLMTPLAPPAEQALDGLRARIRGAMIR